MKKTFTIIAIICILFSCSNSETSSGSKVKPDTSRTLALYTLGDSIARIEFIYRISKETEKFTFNEDSTVATKKLALDSMYFVPHPDSAKIGKLTWAPLPKPFILIDGGTNVDSVFKKYKLRFAQPNYKPDTNKK